MHIIGHGRNAREAYPSPPNAALIALSNRYLIAPTGPASPSAFTVASPAFHIVAAANVVRRASGIFMLSVEMPSQLAAPDTQVWSATLLFGVTASGGVPNGAWLLDIAAPIILTPAPTTASVLAGLDMQAPAGGLIQTVVLTGTNPTPAPQGPSTIVISGTTLGGSMITPGDFFGTVFELP